MDTETTTATSPRTYFRPTTASQRRLLFRQVAAGATVAEILRQARPPAAPTPSAPPAATPAAPTAAVHAPAANQTVNIDLCVAPLTHDGTTAWAAASVRQAAAGAAPIVTPEPAAPTPWPGQVFGDPDRSYPEKMAAYQTQRAAKGQRKHRRRQKQNARQALNARSDELRVARRRQRAARRQADATWTAPRTAQRTARQARQTQSRAERRTNRAAWASRQADWEAARTARQQERRQRTEEDAAWRAARQEIVQALADLLAAPVVSVWLAILVVIDNGTRRCLHLPVFVSGAHVTAAEACGERSRTIVAQLRQHWPTDVQFVISDNGAQFIANAFAQFAQDMGFLHVRIAPHHPQTNGVAERFVRTLKEWLAWHAWQNDTELAALLAEFITYYNDRPHQGAELNGFSPNEYAERLKCATC